jgi:hypothetical protein
MLPAQQQLQRQGFSASVSAFAAPLYCQKARADPELFYYDNFIQLLQVLL